MALGFLEIPFLSITLLVTDRIVKSAGVRLLGMEATGNPSVLVRVDGEVAAVRNALEEASRYAGELGAEIVTSCMPRPEPGLERMLDAPNAINSIYDSREQFLPSDFPGAKLKNMKANEALGIIETQGLTAILEATDAMLKSANVTFVAKEKIGAAYVTVIVRGDVAAVKAAVDAGSRAVGNLGKLIAAHVIARPHEELAELLPK